MNSEQPIRLYTTIEKTTRDGYNVHAIEFTNEPYQGLIFSYGKVELVEDEVRDELVAKYEYEVYQEPVDAYEKEELELYLGDFLIKLISEQLKAHDVIYRGGTDENS